MPEAILIDAIENDCDVAVVELLIKKAGLDFNAIVDGNSAIHAIATKNGDVYRNLLDCMISVGVNLNAAILGKTPLELALLFDAYSIIERLLETYGIQEKIHFDSARIIDNARKIIAEKAISVETLKLLEQKLLMWYEGDELLMRQ